MIIIRWTLLPQPWLPTLPRDSLWARASSCLSHPSFQVKEVVQVDDVGLDGCMVGVESLQNVRALVFKQLFSLKAAAFEFLLSLLVALRI